MSEREQRICLVKEGKKKGIECVKVRKLVHEGRQNNTHLEENLDVSHFQGKVTQKGKGMNA